MQLAGDATRPIRNVIGRMAAAAMALPVWLMLSFLLAPQWVAIAVIASKARHNGFFFYGGGDETWYYTSAWVLGHGHVPQGYISYGYPVLIAPFTWIGGANILNGLPLIIAFNTLVLVPIALISFYGIAQAIGGRGFAYIASFVWAISPLLALGYFYPRYHYKLINIGFANGLGLTALGDFPSMVFLLVAAYFTVKAALVRSPWDALLAGAATGFAIGVKPSNAIFLPVPFAALLVARHGREFQLFALGLMPAIATLALWKYRGTGDIPLLSNHANALAAGRFPDLPIGGFNVHRYISLNWTNFTNNSNQLKEYAWSRRLLGWLVVGGAIGLARRSGALATLIVGWFGVIFVLKTSSNGVSILQGNFLRYILPAYPAFVLLLVSTPLLIPIFGRRLAAAGAIRGIQRPPRKRKPILLVAGILTFIPFIFILLLPPLTKPSAVSFPLLDQYAPANQFALSAELRNRTVRLTWAKPPSPHARPFYDVVREPTTFSSCRLLSHAAASCAWTPPTPVGTTSRTTFTEKPPPGHWVYRIILKAAPTPAKRFGDYLLVSRPVSVTVR